MRYVNSHVCVCVCVLVRVRERVCSCIRIHVRVSEYTCVRASVRTLICDRTSLLTHLPPPPLPLPFPLSTIPLPFHPLLSLGRSLICAIKYLWLVREKRRCLSTLRRLRTGWRGTRMGGRDGPSGIPKTGPSSLSL